MQDETPAETDAPSNHETLSPADAAERAMIDAARRQASAAEKGIGALPGDSTGTADAVPSYAPLQPGARIAGYIIRREIGRGGMGVVYEVEQQRPHRVVALKIVSPGRMSPEALRRLKHEAEILGRLQHPGIAQIYEAGIFGEGENAQPFFAMELVRGEPLTQYAERHKLSLRERLALIVKICHAVQHAHAKGVIHRDLKPGNILVTQDSAGESASGQPAAAIKILDFGVARATDSDIRSTTQRTDIGQLIGTIPYMSPEQAGGDPRDLDTRSDVYALGVVAYELLTGRLPYDLARKMIHEAVRVIREEDPTPLSSINRTLRGDVEVILGKALAKEKDRRYQSASDLASDIERYLTDQPVEARPPSTWYQVSKFARRNRALVGGVVATFAMLVAGLIGTTTYAKRETTQRQKAEFNEKRAIDEAGRAESEATEAKRQRDSAVLTADYMAKIIEGVKASVALGRDTTMLREMLDAAAERVEQGELKDAPEAELRLRWTIGTAYTDIAERGANERAEKILLPTLELAKRTWGAESDQMATSLSDVAFCLNSLGRSAEALPKHEAALKMWQRLFKGDHPKVANSLCNVASGMLWLGRSAEALPKHEAAVEMLQRLYKGDHPDVANGLYNVAYCLNSLGRSAEALSKHEAALEMRQRLFKGDHPDVALSLNNVAICLGRLDRSAEALPKHEAALEMLQRIFKGDHPHVANGLYNVAGCLNSLGRSAEALSKQEAALQMLQRIFKGDHPYVASSLNAVAFCLNSLGRSAEALRKYEAALEMQQRLFTSDHPEVAQGLNNVAACLDSLGRSAEALPKYEVAMEMYKRLFTGDHPEVARGLNNVASCLQWLGRSAEALPKYEEAMEMFRRVLPEGHPHVLHPQIGMAATLISLKRYTEAEPLLTDAAKQCEKSHNCHMMHWSKLVAELVRLYDAWHAAEPNKGFDKKAAEWRARLPFTSKPASSKPADNPSTTTQPIPSGSTSTQP